MSESDTASEHRSAQRGLLAFVKEIYRIWITERPAQFAAALAYYSLFSFVPVIYVAYAVADLLLGRLSTAEMLYAEVSNLFGEQVAQALQEAMIALAEKTAGGTTLTSLIGFVVLVFAASMVFFQLQHALNTIWQVPPPSRDETRAYVKNRLLALVMVLGVGLLVMAATVVGMVVSFVTSRLGLGGPLPVFSLVAFTGLVALAFALVFKLLPNAKVAWRDVWAGAAVTALLVTIGIYVVQLYLSASRLSSALDAAGSAAVFLMGFYFFGQIVVFGAVFTRVYASMFGSKILPERGQGQRADT
jgi:membrane protein